MAQKPVFGEKLLHIDYPRRKGCYGVVIDVVRQQAAAVLTVQGNYFLPGGGMEEGETPEECLRREMLEETGYAIKICAYIGEAERYFVSSRNEPIMNDGTFYLVELIEKVQEPVEDDHLLEWIPLEEIDEKFFHEHHTWAVKQAVLLLNKPRK